MGKSSKKIISAANERECTENIQQGAEKLVQPPISPKAGEIGDSPSFSAGCWG
jgi:hypothetical protein